MKKYNRSTVIAIKLPVGKKKSPYGEKTMGDIQGVEPV